MNVEYIVPFCIKKTIVKYRFTFIVTSFLLFAFGLYQNQFNDHKVFENVGLILILFILLNDVTDVGTYFVEKMAEQFMNTILHRELFTLCKNLPLYANVNLDTLASYTSSTVADLFISIPLYLIWTFLGIYRFYKKGHGKKTNVITFGTTLLMCVATFLAINMYQTIPSVSRHLFDITQQIFMLQRSGQFTESYNVYRKYEKEHNTLIRTNSIIFSGLRLAKIAILGGCLFLLHKYCDFNTWNDMRSIGTFIATIWSLISTLYNVCTSWSTAEQEWAKIRNKLLHAPEKYSVQFFESLHVKLNEYFTSSMESNFVINDKLPHLPNELPLLKNIEFEIHKNRMMRVWQNDEMYELEFKKPLIIVVKGESGKGKTTLLKMIMGIIQSEYVQINGYNVNQIASIDLGNILNYVDQSSLLMKNLTLEENFKLMNINPINGLKMCEKLGLNLENKLNTPLKDIQFSGGEYRRLYLAIAFCKECSGLIMDEPCASLDAARQEQINEILLKNHYDYVIVTEHLGQIGDKIANIRLMVKDCTLSYAIKDHNNKWTELKEGDFSECLIRKINLAE
jgi:iron complex transport system ATP-binding protein